MRQAGRVSGLVAGRGFGFIQREGRAPGEKDMFFHYSAFSDTPFNDLRVGMRVSFEAGVDQSGRSCAERARVVTP